MKKSKKKKDWDRILFIVLLICTILCLSLSITLYLIGIRKILPIILIFSLATISSLIILLLSREVLIMKKRKNP